MCKWCTCVVQMLSKLGITVSSCCNVKVSLDLVPMYTPKDSATVWLNTSGQSTRLWEFLGLFCSANVIVDIVFLVFSGSRIQPLLF